MSVTVRSKLRSAAVGVLVGAVAALVMTLTMLALRVALGVATPPELIGDRLAPLIPVRDFGTLITQAGGYNELKRLGIGSVLAAQLVVGALGGLVYSLIAMRAARSGGGEPGRRRDVWFPASTRFIVAFVGALWLAALLVLAPVLPTHYGGLPPTAATVATALGMLVAFGSYGLSVVLLHRFAARSPRADLTTETGSRPGAPPRPDLGRRAVLVGAVGIAAGAANAALLGRLSDAATFSYDGTQVRGPDIAPITPNDQFYIVTKNVVDARVDPALWRLEIVGAVDRPATYDFGALKALSPVRQETTLMCISNPLGGGLMSNAMWTGVPVAELLGQAGAHPDARELLCRSVDGYSDSIPIEKALDGTVLVAYEMNGVPLPDRHGFPVRLLVPGMYGEKSIKWLTRIEVVTGDARGFYEQQGWGPDFVIPTRSRIDGPDLRTPIRAGTSVVLTGVAFAGDRGVQQVEVTTDGGSTWQPATLTYPGSRLTWALWSFAWRPSKPGDLTLAVRATDGRGEVQSSKAAAIVPQGARGQHVVKARVVA